MGKKKKTKGKNKKNRKRIKKYLNFFIVAIIPIIIAIMAQLYSIKDDNRNDEVLKPRFSIEKNIAEDGFLTWKISNSGGAINNATIYPSIYVSFLFYNEDKDEDTDITIEILGYYGENSYSYNSSDEAFYIKDEKQAKLNEFIDKYSETIFSDDNVSAECVLYFILNYYDYKEKKYNKIYTISSNNFINDNLNQEIFGDNFLQLEEISKIPNPDIIAPLKFEETCAISINYKSAKTKQLIENEKDYEAYLYLAILDLIDSKDKSTEEMLGEEVLSNDGTAWIRKMEIEHMK